MTVILHKACEHFTRVMQCPPQDFLYQEGSSKGGGGEREMYVCGTKKKREGGGGGGKHKIR